jgi:hypothetical protein
MADCDKKQTYARISSSREVLRRGNLPSFADRPDRRLERGPERLVFFRCCAGKSFCSI